MNCKSIRLVVTLGLAVLGLSALLLALSGQQRAYAAWPGQGQALPLSRIVEDVRQASRAAAERSEAEQAVLASAPVAETSAALADSLSRAPLALASNGAAVVTVCGSGCDYASVQAAVSAVPAGGTVKVAAGVYTDTDGDGRVVRITKTLSLLGGYTPADWDTPDPQANLTALDAEGAGQVVYINDNVAATVAGFHIRNGRVAGANGSGLYVGSGNSLIRDNRIYNNTLTNTARYSGGGGVYIAGGDPIIQNNAIYSNSAIVTDTSSFDGGGGGVYVYQGGAQIEGNTIWGNYVYAAQGRGGGGGIYIYGDDASTVVVRDNVIATNTASVLVYPGGGGGVYVQADDSLIEYNQIYSNSLGIISENGGGGIFVGSGTSPYISYQAHIRGNTISRNSVKLPSDLSPVGYLKGGGGIYVFNVSAIVEGNRIVDNRAPRLRGGGILILQDAGNGQAVIQNNVIQANSSTTGGGIGLRQYVGSGLSLNPTIVNNTLYDNRASSAGGGIYREFPAAYPYCSPSVYNNILVSNTQYAIASSGTPTLTVYYSDFSNNPGGDCSTATRCETVDGNLFADPSFASSGTDFHLQAGSGCIDKASPDVYADVDMDGYLRPFGPRADMGAYESYTHAGDTCFAYIDTIIPTQIFTSVQAAIEAADPPADWLIKLSGTCSQVQTISGLTQVAYLTESLTLRGGYALGDWSVSDPVVNPTFLDAQDQGRVVYIDASGAVTIENACLTNGQASLGGGSNWGGGVYVAAGSPVLSAVTLVSSSASLGGGLYNTSAGTVSLRDSTVANNTASTSGGGVYNAAGASLVIGAPAHVNRFYGNTAVNGGALYNAGVASVQANLIYDNEATDGGGVYNASTGQATLWNTMLYANTATDQGGALYAAGTFTTANNTLYGNQAATGGGIYQAGGTLDVLNTIIVSNTASSAGGGGYSAAGSLNVGYNAHLANSPSYGLPAASTDITDENPVFVSEAAQDFHLTPDSPDAYMDEGLDLAWIDFDIDGDSRPLDGGYAIGADEARIPGLQLAPSQSGAGLPGELLVYAHLLTNTSGFTDTISFLYANSLPLWDVQVPGPVELGPAGGANEARTVYVSVTVPFDYLSGVTNTTYVTASLGQYPDRQASVANVTTITRSVGVTVAPSLSIDLSPGRTYSFTHWVTNTGNWTDTYTLTLSGAWASLFVSSTIGSPAVITLGPAVPGYLNWQVVSIPITVPLTAAAFLSKSAVLAATSASNPAVRAVLTDTTTVKPTFGDRFVKMTGDDTENNCAVQFSPCRTVHHAVEQASESDTVKIAEGTYSETELRVNKNITLTGGYSSTTWIARDPLAYPTTLSGGGRDRVIYIPGSGLQPIIDGLVVRDGHTNGQGGGLYVEVSASPVLRNVTFESNHADGHGGAIYIAGGELVITNSVVASNTTQSRGGGIYNAAGELTLFNMMIYSNTAAAGGGVYVGLASAEAVLKNNTFFGNAATTGSGGAVYNAAAALTFINNLVISNTAAAIGGGLYTAGPTDADFNDFWGNSEPASNVSVNAYSFDPLFRDVAAEDFHLQPTSPAIDTGDPTTTLDFDYDLDPRPSGQGFDIGADEFAGCYARLNHLGQDGPIFHNVQDVVDQATLDTDVVKVSGYCWGVHPIQVGNRVVSQTVHLTKTLTLQGGYIHPDWGQAYPITSPAILDAFGLGRVLYVYGQIKPVIAGFVMMGGDAAGLGNHGALGQDAGGLFYNSGADTTISATQFSSGQADVGGGLYNADGGVVYLMRPVTFTGNAAAADGGAVYNYDGWLSITGTTFVDNVAGGSGGGLFNSTLAGALVLRADAFVRNAAEEGSGGGAYVAGGLGTVVVQNNMVISNTAGTSGGGLYVAGGTFNPLNNTFYANSAGEQGGALYNASSGMRSINNTIFMGNEAGASGGAVYNASSVTITLDYNDVLTNTPDYTNSGGRFAFGVSYAVDPLFVDADGGDLHLQELSPLMDAGDPATLLTDDFDGDIRPSQHGFDVGADEIGGCFARIGDGTFTYGSVRLAVEDAAAGDLVKVAGRCIGVWPVADGGQVYTQTLYLTKPITLRGGYLVTNWRTSYVTVSTILDPLSRGRVLVASGPITPTIEKLTLTHGTADRGGGVYVAPGSQPVFSATWLVSNTATLGGGGLYNDGGAPTVFSATLYGNSVGSGASGAGLYNAVGTLAVSRTEIYNNFAPGSGTDCPDGGGGIYNAADAVLLANRVHHNDARCGGAVFNQGAGAFALLQNNMVYSNTAKGNGGGVCNVLGQATLEHNTVYGNEALANGGGVYNGGGSVLVTSTIFASNTATFGSGDGLFNNQGTAVLDYNDWWRNDSAYTGAAPVSGTHNVSMEPLFVNANGTDFHLTPASPLIDLGDPNSTVLVDFEGDARPTFNGFDIGADEVVGCYALNDRTGVLYGSVQRAVDGALAGDLIKLAGECWGVQRRAVGGQIYTQTVYIDKSLTLRGGYSPTNWIVSYPVTWPTTLDARSLGRVVYVAATQPVTVEALRLAGGDATRGDSIGLAAGGAVYNDVSSLVLRGNVISSSMAANGAGFYNAWGESKLQNDVFYSNTASGSGGAIYGANGSLLVLNNTLHGNLALDDGGGVYQAGGTMAITNTIFDLNIAWAGEGGAVYGQPGAASMDYSLFSGSVPTHSNLPLGEHSIEAIPWFMDLYHEDFHLDIGSPAIDAGDPATVLDVDWENDPRPQQQSFDIGADEVGGCYARVNHDGVDGPIMYNVQDAVDSASITDTVKVVGTCWGTRPISLDGDTYTQTVYLDKSLTVQGGYTLTDWIEVDIDSPARLDAQEKGRVVLVTGGAAVSLKNINLEYGDATFAGGPNVGGGLYVISSTAALDYAPLSYNHAQDGGALYVEAGAELTLKDSRSLTNTADRNGGGVYINASIVRVIDQDCTEDNPCSFVEGNTAGGSGGGVYLNGGSLLASAFGTWENSAGLDGGGIYNDGGLIEVHVSFQGANEVQSGSGGAVYQLGAGARTTLQNCLIYYNWAGNGGGGGVYNESGQMYILNCTVDRNFASDYGGAFFNISGTLHIANTIIVSNTVYSTTGSGGGIYCASGTCSEDYDDIWNNFPDNSNIPTGTHTISLMPLFSPGEDEAHEDHEYYLRYDSPCIDMGATLSIPPALNEADYLAVDRPTFAPWDIGAYEYVKEYAVEVSGDKRYADPGQALVYTNWIKNIGNLQDSFTVTVSGPWLVGGSFVTTTPVLTPDEGMSMQVTVSVPLIATTCDQSVVTVTATSRGDPDVSATGMDTTRVNLIPALSWIPDSLQGSGEPGEAITYSHVFSHASNICREAEFAFSPLNNLYSWSSLLTPQVVTLTRYSTSPVQMQVHLLDWVAGGLEDQASLKATLLLRQDDFVDREDWERATKATSGDTFVIAVDRTLISSTTGARYVAVNGNDENNNCTDPEHGACATIQYAVGQAAPGDAVLVSQGIYTGSLLLAKGVRLQGGYTNADWGAPPNPVQRPVVLDAQGSGSVISISGPITVVVSGLGLTGGSATLGGGVYVDATSVTLAANVIDNNTAQAGGGVYVQAGDVRMVNTVVRDNTASDGGGGVYVYSGTATLVHDTLYANHAISGGAVYQAGGVLGVTNTLLVLNTASDTGGAVHVSSGTSALAYNDLWANTAPESNVSSTHGLSLDPLFAAAALGDFHLTLHSPVINAGTPVSVTDDWEGEGRPQLLDWDMGADEFNVLPGLQLEPAALTVRTMDMEVPFVHTLTNTGNYTDVVALTATIDIPVWEVEIKPPSAVTLAPDQAVTVWMTVSVPPTASIGTVGHAALTANSTVLSPSLFVTVLDSVVRQDEADVEIVKTAMPAAAAWLGPDDPITYTLVYTNYGPAEATDVRIVDELPALLSSYTYTHSGPSVAHVPGFAYEWALAAPIVSGAGGIITVSGRISPALDTVTYADNAAYITTTQNDVLPASNYSAVRSQLDGCPPEMPLNPLLGPADNTMTTTQEILFAWKSFGDACGSLGGSGVISYQLIISSLVGSSVYSVTGVPQSLEDPVTASLALPLNRVYAWTVRAFDAVGNPSLPVPSRVITVGLPALAVTKQAPYAQIAGRPFTYTLTVANAGLVDASGVVVTDVVPAGAWYISGGVQAGGVVTWSDLQASANGGTAQVSLVVSACQVVTNTLYRVASSEQGVGSPLGPALGINIVEPPTIVPAWTRSLPDIGINMPVYFTDQTTPTGGDLVTWQWEFGDGQQAYGRVVSHTYTTAGSYTVTLTVTDACNFVGHTSLPLTVYDVPDIAVTPLALVETLGPDGQAEHVLRVDNEGTVDLTWSIADTMGASWLTVAHVSGTVASGGRMNVSVRFDAAGLSAGIYTTTLRIDSNDPDEAVVEVAVMLTVLTGPMPNIAVSPGSLAETLSVSGQVVRELTIGNGGTGELAWSMAEVAEVEWLAAWPLSGTVAAGGSTGVVVTFTAPLTAGVYNAVLCLTSDDPDEAVVEVPVLLTVVDGPVPSIAVSPESLAETLSVGSQAERVLTIGNGGTADLIWSIAKTGDAPWLSVSPVSGTLAGGSSLGVAVRFDAAGLSAGLYAVQLQVTHNDPGEPSILVQVMLTVLAGPVPDIAVSPESLAETLNVGGQVARELTIGNDGTGELAWSIAEVTDEDWLTTSPPSGTLAAGGSDRVVVTFTAPLTAGVYNAVLRLTSDDPDEAVVEVPVLLTVVDGPVPNIAVSPASLAETLGVGSQVERVLTIGNGGTADLIWSIAKTGDAPWLSVSPVSGTLAGGSSLGVAVRLSAPVTPGLYTVQLRITHNDPGKLPLLVQVMLTVLAEPTPNVSVSPESLAETLMVGGQVARALTIGNSGTGELNWAIAEVSDEDWLSVSPLSGTVAAGGSTGVVVTFTAPLTAGVYNAVLRLTSDDPDEPVVEVPVALMARSGPAPSIAVSPESLAETLGAGSQAERVLTIGNGGTADLIWSIAKTGDAPWLSVSPVSGTLAGGSSLGVAVRFDAAGLSAGLYTVQLRIAHNDPGKSALLVQVMLTVLAGPVPDIAVSPESLAETLMVGGQVARALTIGNSGTGGLSWAIAEVSDEDWLSVSPLSGTVAAGSSTGVAVTFTAPLTAGVYNAVLRLTSDDPDEAVVEVPVLLTVVDGPVPSIAVSPESLAETLGAGSQAERVLTVGNGGTADLIWSIAKTGDAPWLSVSPVSGTLAGGSSLGVAVRFDTAGLSAGLYTVQLRIAHNDPGKSALLVQVMLTVLAGPVPDIAVSPESLAETLMVGGQVARALTIGNSGTGGLSWAIAEVSDEDWLNVSPLSGTVAAGSSTGVAVTFTAPLTAGVYNAVLRLTSDDPDEAVVEVPVLLTARSEPAPILTLNPSSLVETLNAGQTATRTLTIGNGGTADLVWSMAETSDVAWLSEAPLSGTLLSGESVNAAVRFDAAGLSAGAHSVQLRLTSNDPGKPVVLVQVTLIVVVEPMPNIIVNPQALTEILNPGGQVVRFVMIVNSGAAGLTWSIAETPEVAWLLVSPLSGTVVAGTDAQVVVTFTAPVTVATYTSVLRITSSDPDQSVLDVPVELEVVSEALVPDIEVTPLSVRVSMPDGNPVQPLRIANVGRAVLTWGPLRESPAVDWLLESKTNGSVPAGGTDSLNLLFDEGVPAGVYTTTLQIFSDDPDEPRVDVQITLLVCEPVSGVSFDYVPLAPSTGQLVTFTARVAAGSSPITYAWNFGDGGTAVANPAYHTFVAGGTYPVVVTVTNVCGGPLTVTHEVMVTGGIFTPTWGVELAPESASANGVQGQQLQYLLTVHNSGNMADTFDLSLAGNAWATSVTPGEVNVSPSGTRQVTVTVTISTTVADGEVDVVTVKAASRGNSSVSDTSTLTTTAVAVVYGVELGAPLDALSGAPGVLVTYTLRLTNTGNMADTFDLSLAGNAWATSVTPGEVNVPPSGTRQITVTVTISTTAADGEVDVVTVKATSRGDPSLSDSSVLTTTALAAAVYGVELGAPLDALSGAPGVSVTYTLRLTNTGNVQDAFTLAAGVSRWVTTLPSELGPLAAGAAADVLAVVQIPSGESAGASDLVTVTAASMGDSSVTSSVQLTTTVARVDYTIYLPVILKSY